MKKTKEEKVQLLSSISKKEGEKAQWKKIAKWNREHADSLEDFVIIAGHIRKVLKDKGWTQTELAKKLEVSPQALTRIMKGRQNLTLQTIRKIETVLDIRLISVHQNNMLITENVSLYFHAINYESAASKVFHYKQDSSKLNQDLAIFEDSSEPYNQVSWSKKHRQRVPFRIIKISTEEFATFRENFDFENPNFQIGLGVQVKANKSNHLVGMYTKFTFQQNEATVLVLESACHYEIESKYWATLEENEKLILTPNFSTHLLMLSVGTARGILHSKKPAWLDNLVLSILDVSKVFGEKNVQISFDS